MKLSHLAAQAQTFALELTGDCDIQSLSADSRIKPIRVVLLHQGRACRFPQIRGTGGENGAAALVVTEFLPHIKVPQLKVTDDRAAMALIARAFYGFADAGMKLIGITGTKGKTTTSYLVKAILERAGYTCGLIGTTGNMIGNQWMNSNLTTPDPIELHKTLRLMADAGCQYVIMEVTAHAIWMRRLEGLVFEAGCFTNLSQDHLDFFGTMEAYFNAKRDFFIKNAVKRGAVPG